MSATTDQQGARPRGFFKRGLHWPALVAVVFLGNIALATWVIVKANTDPSFGVESDYYQKAVNWNDEIDQRTKNEALGWSVVVDGRPVVDASKRCDLRLRVADRDAGAIAGATVVMEAFPLARGHEARTVALDEVLPGTYAARLENARWGYWQLRIRVERATDVFTERLETKLAKE